MTATMSRVVADCDYESSGGSTWRALKQSTRALDVEALAKDRYLWGPYFLASDASSASWASSSWGPYFLACAMGSIRESFSLEFRGRCRDNWQTVELQRE